MSEWLLGDLNVIKVSSTSFRVIGANGALLETDRDTAITILKINGHASYKRLIEELKNCGISADKEELKFLINNLKDVGLLSLQNKKQIPKMNYDKVIRNIDVFKNGPCGISDVSISVTKNCQYRCVYCLRQPIKVGKLIDDKSIHKTIEELSELGSSVITFTGGEPGLVPHDISSYAQEAHYQGIKIRAVATTGDGITKAILHDWKNNGVTHIIVSLDSNDEKEQDNICSFKGAYNNAIQTLRSASKMGFKTGINFTYFGPNLNHIDTVAQIACETKSPMKVLTVVPRRAVPAISFDGLYAAVKKAEKLKLIGFNVDCTISPEEDFSFDLPMICAAGITRAYIEADGKISGCPFLAHHAPAIMGNIKKGFLKVWAGSNWKFYRETSPINEKCAVCNKRKYCIGNCLAQALAIFGDPKMTTAPKCMN